jgi:poly-gamma-glutamate capsule biosynthesis protein CapA/YwtB (metallophosphatase superfamily)
MPLADIVRKARENKMLVIMPHWWEWRRQTFAELKSFGIDGFEICNC